MTATNALYVIYPPGATTWSVASPLCVPTREEALNAQRPNPLVRDELPVARGRE